MKLFKRYTALIFAVLMSCTCAQSAPWEASSPNRPTKRIVSERTQEGFSTHGVTCQNFGKYCQNFGNTDRLSEAPEAMSRLNDQQGSNEDRFIKLPATSYPITAESLPYYSTQLETGSAETAAGVPTLVIEYPEYVALTKDEQKSVKALGVIIDSIITPSVSFGISRKKGLLDVRFCPIICKDRHYYRLVSCKLSVSSQKNAAALKVTGTTSANGSSRWKTQSVLSSGKWVKIRVKNEGIYSLTATALSSMGFSDMSRIKLYGYGGRPQSEDWVFTGSDRVIDDLNEVPLYRRTNDVLFFADGTTRWDGNVHEKSPYSDYSYYFLTEGDSPLAFTQEESQSTAAAALSEVTCRVVLDNDATYIYDGGRSLYDSYNFSGGNSHSFQVSTPSASASGRAQIGVGFAAASNTAVTQVALTMNDSTTLGNFTVSRYGSDESGYESRRTYNVNASTLKATNKFTFTISPSSTAYLDYIRISYPRTLSASDAAFAFSPEKSGAYTLNISNASSSTRLWCLSNADEVAYEAVGQLSNGTYSVTVDDASRRFVIVDADATYSAPEVVGSIENQNLHAEGAYDMVIIIPSSGKLLEQAERLAAAHAQKQGLRVKIVTAAQVYNEFSSGTPDASAYRRYMKMLYDRAETDSDMPRYFLLFGDCAWDNRMITSDWTGYDTDDFLLSFEVNNNANSASTTSISLGDLNSYVTDDFYSWLDDSEGSTYRSNKPDVAVGRFPCYDAETAKVLVDKTIAYMNNDKPGAWKNKVYVLGDDLNNNLHMEGAESVASSISSASSDKLLVRKVYWDAYTRTYSATGYSYPQVETLLQQYVEQGALIFDYIGHGSPDQISHSRVLKTADFARSSSGRLPLWIMASCKISPYDSQVDDIGRTALYNENGGAVAVLCASRSVYADYNVSLNTRYCNYLLQDNGSTYSMGEALMKAKTAVIDDKSDGTMNKLKYVLLGDPALFVSMPQQSVILDSINGSFLTSGTMATLKAGSTARFSGRIVNGVQTNDAFTGYVTATISDVEETITCKNNAGANEAMVYKDRTKNIYEGSDSVIAGTFSIEVPIPRDISYSDAAARATFYAVTNDHSEEATGFSEQFCLNGTADDVSTDTIAPTVYPYLNTPDFVDGGITSRNPVFMADISDNVGINVSGVSIGHDLELVIDNDVTQTYNLNSDFSYNFGDSKSGTVTYQLSDLALGAHRLEIKAWDVNNNSTTAALNFYVGENELEAFDVNVTSNPATSSTNFVTVLNADAAASATLSLEVYDAYGRKVWAHEATGVSTYNVYTWNLCSSSGTPLPSGLYLYKARTSGGESGSDETSTKKIIIRRQ